MKVPMLQVSHSYFLDLPNIEWVVLIIVANINFLIVGQPVEIADQNEMYIL